VKRLWRYLEGQKLLALLLLLVATGNAAAQTGGWLLVRDAIDNGIRAGNERHLTIVVAIYLAVAACGWILQAILIRGLAGLGQRMVLGLRRDLFDHLAVGVTNVTVRRPTLDDVFMKYTGRDLRDADSGMGERMRMNPMVRSFRAR